MMTNQRRSVVAVAILAVVGTAVGITAQYGEQGECLAQVFILEAPTLSPDEGGFENDVGDSWDLELQINGRTVLDGPIWYERFGGPKWVYFNDGLQAGDTLFIRLDVTEFDDTSNDEAHKVIEHEVSCEGSAPPPAQEGTTTEIEVEITENGGPDRGSTATWTLPLQIFEAVSKWPRAGED